MPYEQNITIEVFDKFLGRWVEVPFTSLSYGKIFRIYDQGGTRHKDKYDNTVWIAAGKPDKNKDGILEVQTLY